VPLVLKGYVDQSVEGDHGIEECRLVFPGDHVGLLERSCRHKLACAPDLHYGNIKPEHVETPVGH